jgi:hypothetical protein
MCLIHLIFIHRNMRLVQTKPSLAFVCGEGIEAFDKSPHWRLGRHPIDAPADDTSPQRTPWAADGTTVPVWP